MRLQRLLYCLIALLMINNLHAQIKEETRKLPSGAANALVIELPSTTEKLVNKVWKDFIKNYDGKTKRERDIDGWFTNDAEIIAIGGNNTIDVYAGIVEVGENVEFSMWVDMGGAFVSSKAYPNEYTEAEKILLIFALEVAREQTKENLENEQKELKKLENQLSRLERDNERYNQEIENARERIRRAEADIEQNLRDQTDTQKKIELQIAIVNEIEERLNNLK